MPYDAKLDECLYAKSLETETDRITVSVYSYNKGMKKLQISREARNADGELKFSKLGRLNKDEIKGILPFIQEATSKME